MSHGEAVMPYGYYEYPPRNAPGQRPTMAETRMLTALEMLSAYTVTDDRISMREPSS